MIYITKFLDSLKLAQMRNAKDFSMSINEAVGLHADITKLLLAQRELQNAQQQPQQSATVELAGGDFTQ